MPNGYYLNLSVQTHLEVFVGDFFLVFQKPVDVRGVGHGLVDGLRHGFAVDVEQDLMIQVVIGRNARV